MDEMTDLSGGVARARIRALAARHAESRPLTQPVLEEGAGHFLGDVPMHWMRDWPMPFLIVVARARRAEITIFSAPGGAGQDMVALLAGLTAGLEIPFMLMAGIALKYVSRIRVIAWGALIHAGFMLAFSQWSGLPHVLWLTLSAGIGGGILLSVPLGYIQDLMQHRPGAGGALILSYPDSPSSALPGPAE